MKMIEHWARRRHRPNKEPSGLVRPCPRACLDKSVANRNGPTSNTRNHRSASIRTRAPFVVDHIVRHHYKLLLEQI